MLKVLILCGGYGTRLSEYTDAIPKPMVQIGNRPILWHIMNIYAAFGHKDFYLALGYKSEVIKQYFLNYASLNSDFTIELDKGTLKSHQTDSVDWRVTLIDTGAHTMTGGRVKRMQQFIGDETFLVTYGDGLANININDLIDFHRDHGKMLTVSAVRPAARFGELNLTGDVVTSFIEKPQLHGGWINGGFFVVEPDFFDLIDGDQTMLERDPMERATEREQVKAFCHEGFWQCMDTKRDRALLEKMWEVGAPWL